MPLCIIVEDHEDTREGYAEFLGVSGVLDAHSSLRRRAVRVDGGSCAGCDRARSEAPENRRLGSHPAAEGGSPPSARSHRRRFWVRAASGARKRARGRMRCVFAEALRSGRHRAGSAAPGRTIARRLSTSSGRRLAASSGVARIQASTAYSDFRRSRVRLPPRAARCQR